MNVRDKIHQSLSSIKKDTHNRKLVPFFLSHGVYTASLNRPIHELASTALVRWRRRRKSPDGLTLLLSRHKQRIQYADSTKKI